MMRIACEGARRTRTGTRRAHSGFTLIELLVVIAIITIVATTSLMLVGGFLKGTSVKEGGRIVQAAFSKARQAAATKRRMHFLVFDIANNSMSIFEDTDNGRAFSDTKSGTSAVTGPDLQVGEAMSLPQNCYFDKVFGQTTGAPYATFQSDGSVLFYNNVGSVAVVSDQSWTGTGFEGAGTYPSGLMTKSDIILRLGPDTTNAPDKVFCDILGIAGIVRKVEYWHKDGFSW